MAVFNSLGPARLSPSRSRRGATLVEMFVAVTLFLLVSIAVSYLLITAAKASQDGLMNIRSESRVRIALDSIRKEVLVGEFMSVQIQNNGKTVVFKNPVRKTTAMLQQINDALIFKSDTSVNTVTRRFEGITKAQFSLKSSGTILRCELTADCTNSGQKQRPIVLADEILMRNMPTGAVF
jgi:type II secretory pathway component PulJ